jgi:hypothetical protein
MNSTHVSTTKPAEHPTRRRADLPPSSRHDLALEAYGPASQDRVSPERHDRRHDPAGDPGWDRLAIEF